MRTCLSCRAVGRATSAFFKGQGGIINIGLGGGIRSRHLQRRDPGLPGAVVTPEERSRVMVLAVVPGHETFDDFFMIEYNVREIEHLSTR